MAENRYTKAARAAMLAEKHPQRKGGWHTRAARAAMLAEKHPQVEEFEEAGGVVEDLPTGARYVHKLEDELPLGWHLSGKGPRGVVTPHSTIPGMMSYPATHLHDPDATEKTRMEVAASPVGGQTYSEAMDSATENIRRIKEALRGSSGLEFLRLIDDLEAAKLAKSDLSKMAQDIYEESPFAKRAKKYGKPGEEYREEGGE